ncbi:MAG: hypothetical protein L0H19_05210 [Salinisphaera sp.]|nr:hypothetical protein [Salinisphaera sp.]MDN5938357.1 hypothetical protein [Salinisphaera sp.]
MTSAEHQAALSRKLEGSLEEFDQRLAREAAELEKMSREAQARAAARGASTGGGESQAGGPAASPGGMAAGSEISEQAGGPSQETGTRSGRGAPSPDVVAARTPEDIGNGSGDDIVAQQLREAAVNEEDPELRAKLWDEYRAYKASH